MSPNDFEITALLQKTKEGDDSAREQLFERISSTLRSLARGLMKNEKPDHTLQASALVNEACIRMLRDGVIDTLENRRHLFGVAIRAMRQTLVDHARTRNRVKRGGEFDRQPMDVILDEFTRTHDSDFLDLDEALNKLEVDAPRQREIVELRFFCGLTISETANLIGVGSTTIEDDWRLARAKLFRWLNPT